MKKLLSMLLAIAMLATMALGVVTTASAEETEKATSTAWLLYFASNHEKDSANFPWWPQHQRVDQPASETGVEATNAEVTGPGKYTVGLKFNWQKAEGAIQFNLILDDAEKLFPGYYVDITDIRVNGVSIEKKENMYGVYHDDPDSGMVSIYNSYWDPAFTPGATGPSGHRAFDGTVEDASYLIINPDDIVAGDTIEVDFIFAREAGAAPEEVGDMPYVVPNVEPAPAEEAPEKQTTAWLYYVPATWWPANDSAAGNDNVATSNATITGDGHYTVSLTYQHSWTSTNGAQKLQIVVEDGNTLFPDMYLNVTDVRVDGVSIACGAVGYGSVGYDAGYATADDTYSILFDQWMVDNNSVPWGHETWDGSDTKPSAMNGADIPSGGRTLEVDFFLSSQQNVVPPTEPVPEYVYYPRNTVGVAGLSLKDLGIADDWHNIVPVDLTTTGWQRFTLVGADAHEIGDVYVCVNNGVVTMQFEYVKGEVYEHSQCVKWFTSLDQITAEELASIEGGLTGADPVSIEKDLGGASVAYLSINNKVTFRSPVDRYGNLLPRYWRNAPVWVAYREQLMSMIPADAE
ncbi:MAG: hypothetical protein ACI4MG_04200 [Aristaeellaceae bacterium]